MKKYLCFLTFFLLSPFLLFPLFSAHAQEKAQAESATVSATVDSPVSVEKSKVTLNTIETLADPVNHPILLAVTLYDKDQKPLPDRGVFVTSNRGDVDVIEATSKLSQYQVHAAEISDMQKDKTDKDGKVSFRITSFIPGKVILQVLADNVVALDTQTIQFKTLPFPTELTITLALPWTQQEWTIFSPQLQEENLTPSQKEAKIIANPGTKIKINFWVFAPFLLIGIGIPIFIILNFLNLRKMHKMEKEQTLLLKKMFPPNYNRQS
ncbi:hypothetical protein A2V71_01395 [Candidatus Berkelbacteria bacterium RBG_13_40_8]|uniref:Big-1 domain-containing protein n=1 Tax=Candidatus Berkelbacteria bacterium RBG_13_40_8 TaxID=1797467 RepID=A0A1F5DMJ6_9BACT|nr:MAG: hypothetical protein A2V71_01395 [Candidatus Berkelbacteria bacterium RBG_13_40_8]